ncbi:MAG: protein-export chaperone SecB [Gammaproteobacteria bacterium]|nr:protein-export chaperone SecB [Gammaproteobacteria bacterium]
MSEAQGTQAGDGQSAATADSKVFDLQKIYIKDMSFENPNAPQIFTIPWQPRVGQHLSSRREQLGDGVYEVILSVTLTVSLGERTAYLVEVHQAGIFRISGYPAAQLDALLGSYCLKILHPYIREAISDLIAKGGYPQFLLPPIDFDGLYADYQRQRAASQPAAASA